MVPLLHLSFWPLVLAGKGGPHEDGLGALLLSAHCLRDAKSPGPNWGDADGMGPMVLVRCQSLVQFPTLIELPAVESHQFDKKMVVNRWALSPHFVGWIGSTFSGLCLCWRSGISQLRSLSGQIFVWRVILHRTSSKTIYGFYGEERRRSHVRFEDLVEVNPMKPR